MNDFQKQQAIEEEAIRRTSSYKKTLSYLTGLFDDSDFKKDVVRLRKKHNLPKDGLPEILYDVASNGYKRYQYPQYLTDGKFYSDVGDFCEKYGLDLMWSEVFEIYIIFNHIELDVNATPMQIQDIGHQASNSFIFEGDEFYLSFVKKLSKTHPVAILLNPYSSEREILDYVRKLYKIRIEPLQISYRNPNIKLGKFKRRKSSIKERNDFIYKHKHLPLKEISKLIITKFGSDRAIDEGYIGKIISMEKKRRKDV